MAMPRPISNKPVLQNFSGQQNSTEYHHHHYHHHDRHMIEHSLTKEREKRPHVNRNGRNNGTVILIVEFSSEQSSGEEIR